MNVVDSSGWLEYLSNGPNADFFAAPLENVNDLIVPALSIFEVFKRVLQQRTETEGLQAAALMQQGRVIPLTTTLALAAARLSVDEKLPLADSVILSTARAFDAILWTQDADFDGRDDVRYKPKTL